MEIQHLEKKYKQLYPKTHGWFFEPLNPTIWVTHAHYLYTLPPNHNKWYQPYRILFDIVSYHILNFPEILQPKSAESLIHTVHLISTWQHNYHNWHKVPIAFKKWVWSWGHFDYRIKDTWSYLSRTLIYTYSPHGEKEAPYDILLDERSIVPNLTKHYEIFLSRLNSRNNKALQQIYSDKIYAPDLKQYSKEKPITIRCGKYSELIQHEASNIHLFSGLLYYKYLYPQKTRRAIKNMYQRHINSFSEQHDIFDYVYFVSNAQLNSNDPAFSVLHDKLRQMMKWRYDRHFEDYSPDQYDWLPIHTPDLIIDNIEHTLHMLKKEWKTTTRVLFVLWLHGNKDWSADYMWGNFTLYHFQRIFDLANNNSQLQLFINSCRSGTKTWKLGGNVIMSSSQQVSYVDYLQRFSDAFSWADSFFQSHVYAMTKYNLSLLPTSYINEQWETIIITPLSLYT